MPRLSAIAYDDLPQSSRKRIDRGVAGGMFTTTAPLQVIAHSPVALEGTLSAYEGVFGRGVLGGRLQELLRLRSAQLNMCAPCSQSRKDDSVTEDDVACLIAPDEARYSTREVLALHFLDLFATNHHAIDDVFFKGLHEHFADEEIVELGYLSWQFVGGHRFMHILDVVR